MLILPGASEIVKRRLKEEKQFDVEKFSTETHGAFAIFGSAIIGSLNSHDFADIDIVVPTFVAPLAIYAITEQDYRFAGIKGSNMLDNPLTVTKQKAMMNKFIAWASGRALKNSEVVDQKKQMLSEDIKAIVNGRNNANCTNARFVDICNYVGSYAFKNKSATVNTEYVDSVKNFFAFSFVKNASKRSKKIVSTIDLLVPDNSTCYDSDVLTIHNFTSDIMMAVLSVDIDACSTMYNGFNGEVMAKDERILESITTRNLTATKSVSEDRRKKYVDYGYTITETVVAQ